MSDFSDFPYSSKKVREIFEWLALETSLNENSNAAIDCLAYLIEKLEAQEALLGTRVEGEFDVPVVLPEPSRRKAPWKDFAGNEVHEGDTLIHPDNQVFTVCYEPDRGESHWRADYDDGTPTSNLYMQLTEKGRAVLYNLKEKQ